MPDYAVFGGRLRSALRMAGLSPLPPAGTPPDHFPTTSWMT